MLPALKKYSPRLDKDSKVYLLVTAVILSMAILVFAWYERKVERIESEMNQIRTQRP
jgi:hypothetical protein